MTREEVKVMLTILKTAYPNAYKNMSKESALKTVELYHNRFEGYSSDLVVQALNLYVDENEYPPTVAGIKKYITLIKGGDDYEQMFNELWSAICGNKKFEDLCPQNQRYIQSQRALDDLGQSDSTIREVVHGQYLKRIGTICDEQRAQKIVENTLGSTRLAQLQGKVMMIGKEI